MRRGVPPSGRRRRSADGTLWRIEGPNFVCGLVVADGVVRVAAPLLKSWVGWTEHQVRVACLARGYTIQKFDK